MGFVAVIVLLLALAVLAPVAGADSRGLTGRSGVPPDPPPRRSAASGAVVARVVGRVVGRAGGWAGGRAGGWAGAWGGGGAGRGLRLGQLFAGLVLYGVSMAFFVQARLGVMPWDVLHQGLTHWVPLTLGQMTIAVAVVVLLAWIPLRQRPGVGTLCNVVAIGVVVDLVLAVLPAPSALGPRVGFLLLGVVLNAVATAAYIGARLGPGPRDGLMTGLVARTGRPVRLVRTSIEVAVVAVGWLLGGNLGPGTVLYALAIGPLVQPLLPLLDSGRRASRRVIPAPPLRAAERAPFRRPDPGRVPAFGEDPAPGAGGYP